MLYLDIIRSTFILNESKNYILYYMKNQQATFLELPDEIPYKKITYFRATSVLYKNNQFEIKVDRKCENLPYEQQYMIKRKIVDFQWLIAQLQKQTPDLVVLPYIVQNSWSFLQAITSKLSDHSRTEMKRWSNQHFLCRMAQRFLKILSEIAIHNIYRVPGFIKSSLFTFLDMNYELYKLQTYQQSNLQKNNSRDSNSNNNNSISTFSSIAQSLGQGGIKILGMLNVIKKQSAREYLQNELKLFSGIEAEMKQFNIEIENIEKSMDILIQNFLNEKGLKQKTLDLFQIYLRSSGCHKMVAQIVSEINNISTKCETIQTKNEDKQGLRQQIKEYQKFLSIQYTHIKKQFLSITQQYFKRCFENQIKIRLFSQKPIKTLTK